MYSTMTAFEIDRCAVLVKKTKRMGDKAAVHHGVKGGEEAQLENKRRDSLRLDPREFNGRRAFLEEETERMGSKAALHHGVKGGEEAQLEDERRETVGVGPVTVRFLERFTGHALGRSAYPESSFFRKLFWLIVFFIATGYMIYQIVDVINLYMSNPTTTGTQMVTRDSLQFPAVTICPHSAPLMNMADVQSLEKSLRGVLKLDRALQRVLRRLSRAEDECSQAMADPTCFSDAKCGVDENRVQSTCIRAFDQIYWSIFPQPDEKDATNPDGGPEFGGHPDGVAQDGMCNNQTDPEWTDDSVSESVIRYLLKALLRIQSFTLEGFLEQTDVKSRRNLFDMEKAIRHCSFNQEPCNPRDFGDLLTSEYGNCITFNADGKHKVNATEASQYGYRAGEPSFFKGMDPSKGLQLILTSYTPNDLRLLSTTQGFRIKIHAPSDTEGDTIGDGFDVNFDEVSYIGVRKLEFERLHPGDGGTCALDSYLDEHLDTSLLVYSHDMHYRKKTCLDLCYRRKVLRDFGKETCDWSDPLDFCYSRAFRDAEDASSNKGENLCGCPPYSCTYVSTRSKSSAHEDENITPRLRLQGGDVPVVLLLGEVGSRDRKAPGSRRVDAEGEGENRERAEISELLPTAPWTSFVGTVGGLLGLYTGLSFISVMEMLEWILDLLLYGWRKPRKDKIGPTRTTMLTLEAESRKKVALDPGPPWGYAPVYTRPSLKDTQRAGFDLAFSNYHF
ncbi:unnamed protein product [Darwinula stevensoni]|uniref:Uncharacterized protein n=1 Tax=Darwinula stevensoni TaxID=69355 RepID=A0A7R9ABR5_9CRUS|nr:unnamed protein product [Darwinula stevensoni]CAG0899702.1 unnamed protein product [Darwinula stevensoni]